MKALGMRLCKFFSIEDTLVNISIAFRYNFWGDILLLSCVTTHHQFRDHHLELNDVAILFSSGHFVHVPCQWETTLHFSVISHWMGALSMRDDVTLWPHLSVAWRMHKIVHIFPCTVFILCQRFHFCTCKCSCCIHSHSAWWNIVITLKPKIKKDILIMNDS